MWAVLALKEINNVYRVTSDLLNKLIHNLSYSLEELDDRGLHKLPEFLLEDLIKAVGPWQDLDVTYFTAHLLKTGMLEQATAFGVSRNIWRRVY